MESMDLNQTADILLQLRTFIAGATRTIKYNDLELAKTALSLLKTLPAVRDAVLEYFFTIFDTSVKKYVTQIENEQLMNAPVPLSQQEDAVISEIYSVICSFVTSNPEAWAPIISTWSLKLLGEVSSHYSHLPTSVALHETLQLWMSCKATRTLVDITTQCLSCLINSDTETCINALLDTSVAHSPHFDWVVAHVGSCFPHTVITRVLSCGLKDFCSKGTSGQAAKMAKLNSVVGILGHLAFSQFVNIREALLDLFKWSVEDTNIDLMQRVAVVPYLLQLASKSSTLHRALLTEIQYNVTPDIIPRLATLAPLWIPYFNNDVECLEDLVVHLLITSDVEGSAIVTLFLSFIFSQPSGIALTCQVLLELLLNEINEKLRSSKPVNIPLLESVKCDVSATQYIMTSGKSIYIENITCRILRAIGVNNISIVIESSSHLLLRSTTNNHLALLTQFVSYNLPGAFFEEKNVLALALEHALRMNTADTILNSPVDQDFHRLLWTNLSKLLGCEASGKCKTLQNNIVSKAIRQNLVQLSDCLYGLSPSKSIHDVASVLEQVAPSYLDDLPVQVMLRITRNCIKYFFSSISIQDRWEKAVACHRARELLSRLCSRSTPSRSLALRELLESSLFLSVSTLFGAATRNRFTCSNTKMTPRDGLLMEQNHKLGTTTILAQRQSCVFGNGVIGHGIKEKTTTSSIDQEIVDENTAHLIQAIRVCCVISSEQGIEESLDAMVQVSLLLVELISPDVMYNGLPWPEEEFCKVTIERDLLIRRVFDELPLTWKLLDFVARNEPALCYSSVLLRALAATLISQWSASASLDNKMLMDTTIKLLKVMSIGQLLPKPLACLYQIIPLLTPPEVVTILRECVWNYMRDTVPSPALFSRNTRWGIMWRDPGVAKPSAQYTEPLRLILQSNIQHFGDVYAKLFILPSS